MPKLKDLTGRRFGKLVVTGLHPERTKRGATRWLCSCDCGGSAVVTIMNLGRNTNSCGCAHYSQYRLTTNHRFSKKWSSMIERCTKPNHPAYKHYGARGITVCERWMLLKNFVEDMEPTWFEGATLDRINNDKGYSPENCRWATRLEQTNNRRCTVTIDTPWGNMTIAEAAKRAGMPRERLKNRVKLGWTIDEMFDPRNKEPLTKWSRRGSSKIDRAA